MHFGIDLDTVGLSVSVWQVAACAACLPPGSRVLAGYDPRAAWTSLDWRMREVACAICGRELPYPWDAGDTHSSIELAAPMPRDELLAALYGTEWEECRDGNSSI